MGIGRQAASVLAAGATLFAVGAAFHLVVPALAPGIPPQYADAALFRGWSGWTSTYMAIHPFAYGVVFAAAYLVLLHRGGVDPGPAGGFRYGLALFLVGGLPVYALAFASFQVSPEVMASWIAQGACQYGAAGAAIGLINRPQGRG